MSYKNLYNIYAESVAGKSYQVNRETLLLELTVNEASIKRFCHQYMQYEIHLDFNNPDHKKYLTGGGMVLNELVSEVCFPNKIYINPEQIISMASNIERVTNPKYRRLLKELAIKVSGSEWRQHKKESDQELARYLSGLQRFDLNVWGDHDLEDDPGYITQAESLATIMEGRHSGAHMWSFYPMQDGKKLRLRFRFNDHYIIARGIMNIFNVRQKMLANKDIFAYTNLFELVKALATTRSKAELKKAGADVENTIREIRSAIIPCDNENWIVIKPPNHAFSKKYFGFSRYSIRDILAIANRAEKDPANRDAILDEIASLRKIQGSQWCTTANKDTHWKLYINDHKTELYYFISLQDMPEEELFAVRTLGSYGNLANYNAPMNESQLNKLGMQMEKDIGYSKGRYFIETTTTIKEVPSNMYGRWVRLSPLDNLNVLLNYNYHNFFANYVHHAVIETRDTENEATDLSYIMDSIGEEWFKQNINFITGIPSMSPQDASKTALDICMQKREASSKEVETELLQKFKM